MRLALAAALFALLAAPAGAAPRVTTMVVGKDRVLSGPHTVTAKKARVKVAGHRCAVGRATPLAALVRLHLRVKLRDYGAGGRRAADGGGLFVTRIGPDRNRGQNGWVYKVGHRVPSTGAADTSGRRLRTGARLVWFWCRQGSGGCQRTLDTSVQRMGNGLRVTVRGYDDNGRGRLVPGATVSARGVSAQTGADGVALLAADGAVTATAPGMVPSFPRVAG
jgi:hypothetical protein